MPTQNPQWRHHYVPEFYLKRWQLGGDRLVEFSRPHGRQVRFRWVSPKQTGFVDKLYFLSHLPEEQRNSYEERFFQRVDTRASVVLNKIESGQTDLSSYERTAWARFLMSMLFRMPENLQSVHERLAKDVFEPSREDSRAYRKRRLPGDPATLREALELERDDNYISQLVLQVTTSVANSARVGHLFINMDWGRRVFAFDTPALLTSDRPIMWTLGMNDPDCHIVIPTGPKSIFWAARNIKMVSFLQNTPGAELVRLINDHVTRRAVKYVWGASPGHLEFVRRFMGNSPPRTVPDILIEQRWSVMQAQESADRARSTR